MSTVAAVDDQEAARFQHDAANHEMTVLHDDGLYRHVRFIRVITDEKTGKQSQSSAYWFDLVTWPGSLTVNGDCGTFTFSRLDDMFQFFRGDRDINPGYWAEKVRAQDRSGVTAYSPEKFRQFAMERAGEAEDEYPGLTAAVEADIFGDLSVWSTETADGAQLALADFGFGDTYTVACTCGGCLKGAEYGAAEAWRVSHIMAAYPGGHSSKITRIEGFRFTDAWEWDLSDFGWQFLWCCHAIHWGIRQYDAAQVTP